MSNLALAIQLKADNGQALGVLKLTEEGLDRVSAAAGRAGAGLGGLGQGSDRATAAINKIPIASEKLKNAYLGMGAAMGKTAEDTDRNVSAWTKLAQVGSEVGATLGGLAGRIPLIGGALAALGPAGLTAAAGLVVAGLAIKDIAQTTIKMESLEAGIKGLVGSDRLAETMGVIQGEAKRAGVGLETVADGYKKFLALQQAGILTTGEAQTLLKGFNDAAMATSATSAQLGQSLYGLAQGLSSGSLMMEELRQVTDPIPGLLQKLDKASGFGVGGFRRMAAEGKVTSDVFREVLIKALKDYEEQAKASANTTEREFTRLGTAWENFKNAPWMRKPLSAVAGGTATIVDNLSGRQKDDTERLAILDERIKAAGGRDNLRGGDRQLLVQRDAIARRMEVPRRIAQEREDREKATRAKGQEEYGQVIQDYVLDTWFEATGRETVNEAKPRGNYAALEAERRFRVDKEIRDATKDLAQKGQKITSEKEDTIRLTAERKAAAETTGPADADVAQQAAKLDLRASGEERLAEAAKKGALAQMEAQRAMKVADLEMDLGAANAAKFGDALKRIDHAGLAQKANEMARGLDLETAANERLAKAAGGTVEEVLAAEKANWLAAQADKGLTDANGELAKAFDRVTESRTRAQVAADIAGLEREIAATRRLGEAIDSNDRARVRRTTIDNEVADYQQQKKLKDGDPDLDRYRKTREKAYAEKVKDEARQTNLAYDATARYAQELAKLQEQMDTGLISQEAYALRYRQLEMDKLNASREWADGAKRAFKDYAFAASDAAAQSERVVVAGLRSMEDALVQWRKTGQFSAKAIGDAIIDEFIRAQVQQNITGPLSKAFSSFSLGDLFKFAGGGVMTPLGAMPLRTYSGGGVADSPQLALYGEGSMNEAYVPLPDGRRIPAIVEFKGMPPFANTVGSPIINLFDQRGGNAPPIDIRRRAGSPMEFDAFICDAVNRGFVSGRFDASMQTRYGQRARGIS